MTGPVASLFFLPGSLQPQSNDYQLIAFQQLAALPEVLSAALPHAGFVALLGAAAIRAIRSSEQLQACAPSSAAHAFPRFHSRNPFPGARLPL
jgi:hypothetical protein